MKRTVKDFELKNKRVLLRCDLNVPIENGKILDDTRIRASLKTINYIIDNGGSVIILSHLGKVKSEEDKEKNNLYPVSVRLSELLGREVLFSNVTRGVELEEMVSNLGAGDVLLVQNTRYEDLDGEKESSCDMELAKYWAGFGDIFINDAYGTMHRAHASNVGICKYLPNGLGFLPNEELSKIDNIMNENTHPFIVIMGGAKVSDKIKVINNLIMKCDKLLIGGGMAFTFLKAKGYEIGKSLFDEDSLDYCRDLLDKYSNKLVLPVDCVVSVDEDSDSLIKDVDKIDVFQIGFDIGPKSIKLFQDNLKDAKRIIINGPMGLFENSKYCNGTKAIYDYIIENNIKTLIGGGDSASSVNKLSDASKFYHISTGGGVTLKYLEGKELPGVSVIDEKEE